MLVARGATTTPPRSSAPRPLSVDAVAFGPDAVSFYGSASSYQDGLPRGWSETNDVVGAFADMYRLARVVYKRNACELPGVNIKFDTFIPYMWKAVRLGYVQAQHAEFVQLGLRWGFEVGLHPDRVRGHRFFKNYESSTSSSARSRVTEATEARVSAGKTLHLGAVRPDTLSLIRQVFDAAYIFPMGATAKPLEPTKLRPTDDHTRTGLNAACDMTGPPTLSYSLDAYAEMGRRFLPGYAAHVTDVEAAFPMLPFAPWVWPFMFHRFYSSEGDPRELHLYCHLTGDFGTRGMPGVFKIFFVDVVLNMARAAHVLTIPLSVYVDDLCATGPKASAVTRRVVTFQAWAEEVCGVTFKQIKDKAGSQVQLFVGFWWDSFAGTRTLEERKLFQYMDMFLAFSERKTLSLHERQVAAGRMLRAVMTMPPGASCLLANIFLLMVGLSVAWQKRRTTRRERQDFRFFHYILNSNMGRGYYTTDRFQEGPTVYSDASRSSRYAGGGWCSSWGPFDYWRYGTAAARKPIDFLEGDTMICSVESQGPMWAKRLIRYKMDNQAFQKSAVKGWSRADRLNLLLKRLFVLQITGDFLLCFNWVSSEDNEMADLLSREGGIELFPEAVKRRAFVDDPALLQPMPGAGRVRNLDMSIPFGSEDMKQLSARARAPVDMLWLSRALPAIVCIQAVARGWLHRRAQTRAQVSPPGVFGAFIGRWAPGKTCIYGRLERAYFFPATEGERLFAKVLALGLGLSYFMVCVVTGMLLALSTDDRVLLEDDAQLRFSAAECVEVKREHMARSIQVWWRYLTACWVRYGARSPPRPLPPGAIGWCACTYHCPQPVYPGDGPYCDHCGPVDCTSGCRCHCQCTHWQGLAESRPRVRRGRHGRHGARRLLVISALMGLAGAAPRDGYSSQVASVQYPRASLYDGLPVDLLEAADELMSNRLSPSSMATVNIAFERYWTPLADEHGWPVILETDDPERGGKMAAFVLRLIDDTNLVADSIQAYVWGLRWKMKLAHQADPVLGVMHWQEFMRSVRVKSHVPHEPRRTVPLRLILAILASIDVTVFWEVQFAFLLVVMLFTFSRSECPCPKAFTGKNAWDDTKHWMVRDIVIRGVSGVYVLAVRFKSIKQDRRIERPEARGDHRLEVAQGEATKGGSDWSFVGDIPGHALSPFKWYRLLMGFYSGPRAETSPFFMAMDRTRPYTYTAAMKDFKTLLRRVSPEDTDYGLHGLRVEGWNLAAAVDPDLAEAHGGWKPGNASRYSRFNLASVFNLSRNMINLQAVPPPDTDGDDDDAPGEVAVGGEDDGDVASSHRLEAGEDDEAGDMDEERDVIGSPSAPPVVVQPRGPPAVVPPVAEEPHGYVGAALRMVANSPPSRALTRLRASMLQQP